MILVRLSFVIPYNISNMVLGASNIKYRDFLVGNLWIWFDCAFIVYVGTSASTIQMALSGE